MLSAVLTCFLVSSNILLIKQLIRLIHPFFPSIESPLPPFHPLVLSFGPSKPRGCSRRNICLEVGVSLERVDTSPIWRQPNGRNWLPRSYHKPTRPLLNPSFTFESQSRREPTPVTNIPPNLRTWFPSSLA